MTAAILVVAAAVRLYYAHATYLNPDEAMHYSAAAQPTWAGAYEASRQQAHPPFLVLFTHAWLPWVGSELSLRLPSVLAGLLTLWIAHRWLELAAGPIAALGGLVFLCVSPAMISTASELRHTAILLPFACAALYWGERMASRPTVRDALFQSLALCAAFLSHYSAAFVVAALFPYTALRLWLGQARRSVWIAWIAGQGLVASTAYWSLFVHGARWAPKLTPPPSQPAPGTSLPGAAKFHYLAPSLHQKEKQSALTYVGQGAYDAWVYLCGSPTLAIATLIALALAFLLTARASRGRSRSGVFFLLALAPFLLAAVAGLLRQYPFGGTRHVAFLLPFAAAAIGLALDRLTNGRWQAAAALSAILVPVWLTTTVPANDPARMPRHSMQEALALLATRPAQAPLIIDFQTRQVLEFYWRGRARPGDDVSAQLKRWKIGRNEVVGPHYSIWALTNGNMQGLLKQAMTAFPMGPDEEIWAFSLAWPNQSPVTKLPQNLVGTTLEFGQSWILRAKLRPALPKSGALP